MLVRKITFAFALASLVLGPLTARAQENSALLDLLVHKRILTEKEADDLRGELAKDKSQDAASKLKMSTPVTELELYGDTRVRYEIRNGDSGAPGSLVTNPNDTLQRDRARYRIRIGLRGTLVDDWFFGLRLETSTSPRSTNVTFGDDAGPFGKTSDGGFVGQAYIGYKGIRDTTLTVGRMPNPFVNTTMVWDSDINPEGAAEQFKHTFVLGGSTAPIADAKDAKSAGPEPFKKTLEVFANFGQFVYDDNNPENPIGNPAISGGRRVPENDAYMLGWQLGAKYTFAKDTYIQIAPTLYNYTGYGNDFNTFFSGDPNYRVGNDIITPNQTGINSLLVFDMPAEFGFKLFDIPMRVFSDFAANLDADDRATAAGHPEADDERYAYQIGVQLGKIKSKHDWQLAAFWQHTEQYALDPNLVDSDLFDSRVNVEGVVLQAGYALSSFVTVNLTYAYGEQINDHLGTGGVGDIGVNPLRQYQLFQADLNLKF